MSEYCTNCKTLADLNINQAKTIKEVRELLRQKDIETERQQQHIDKLELQLKAAKHYECGFTDCGWQKKGKQLQQRIAELKREVNDESFAHYSSEVPYPDVGITTTGKK